MNTAELQQFAEDLKFAGVDATFHQRERVNILKINGVELSWAANDGRYTRFWEALSFSIVDTLKWLQTHDAWSSLCKSAKRTVTDFEGHVDRTLEDRRQQATDSNEQTRLHKCCAYSGYFARIILGGYSTGDKGEDQ